MSGLIQLAQKTANIRMATMWSLWFPRTKNVLHLWGGAVHLFRPYICPALITMYIHIDMLGAGDLCYTLIPGIMLTADCQADSPAYSQSMQLCTYYAGWGWLIKQPSSHPNAWFAATSIYAQCIVCSGEIAECCRLLSCQLLGADCWQDWLAWLHISWPTSTWLYIPPTATSTNNEWAKANKPRRTPHHQCCSVNKIQPTPTIRAVP